MENPQSDLVIAWCRSLDEIMPEAENKLIVQTMLIVAAKVAITPSIEEEVQLAHRG